MKTLSKLLDVLITFVLFPLLFMYVAYMTISPEISLLGIVFIYLCVRILDAEERVCVLSTKLNKIHHQESELCNKLDDITDKLNEIETKVENSGCWY